MKSGDNLDLTGRLAPLKEKLGPALIFDTGSFPAYARDASEIRVVPPALAFPENENDVIGIVDFCRQNRIPIVFRGAGTGYTGGAVPVAGGLVVSLEKLKTLEVDPEKKLARCGPGVITIDLMNRAAEHGLYYPPDPASHDESTLGGNVAECAGGLHCKKYGVTRDYVIGLRGVTADASVLLTGVYAPAELFNLSAVLTGSEGLLAAITEIAVRLIARPEFGPTILAAFNSAVDAARAIAAITRAGLVPSVLEYMDADSVACSMEYEKALDISGAEAVILVETSGPKALEEADRIEHLCRTHRAVFQSRQTDRGRADRFWSIRRNISEAVKKSAARKISEDVCVPPSRLPDLIAFVAEMNREYPVRINSYGHAGDGNLHVNFLARTGGRKEKAAINEGIERLFKRTLELGGTISGEHGIGLTKKDYLHLEFDTDTLESMKNIKAVFDPDGILNPGKMFLL